MHAIHFQWEILTVKHTMRGREKKIYMILHLNMQFQPKINLNQHAIIKAPMDYSDEVFHYALHSLQNRTIQLTDGFKNCG